MYNKKIDTKTKTIDNELADQHFALDEVIQIPLG
jgi:hypothetical protein